MKIIFYSISQLAFSKFLKNVFYFPINLKLDNHFILKAYYLTEEEEEP